MHCGVTLERSEVTLERSKEDAGKDNVDLYNVNEASRVSC